MEIPTRQFPSVSIPSSPVVLCTKDFASLRLQGVPCEVDTREPNPGPGGILENRFGFQVQRKILQVGDYRVTGRLIVERKTSQDFHASVLDGRIFRQAATMNRTEERALIIVEGNLTTTSTDAGIEGAPKSSGMSWNAVQGVLVSLMVVFRIPVLFTANMDETALSIGYAIDQLGRSGDTWVCKSGYRPRKLRSRQLKLVSSLPRVGGKRAAALLDQFGSVRKVMAATPAEMEKVDGVGEVIAREMCEVLDAPWTRSENESGMREGVRSREGA